MTTRSHWAKTALAAASPGIAVVFFIEGIPYSARVASVFLVCAIEGILYHFGEDKEVNVLLTPPIDPVQAKDLLRDLVKTNFGWRYKHYRANIMKVDHEHGVIRMWGEYNMGSATPAEHSFAFVPGQGAAGQAWQRNDFFFLDLNKHKHEQYGVRSSDVAHTVKSIVAVPIRLEDGITGAKRVVGILSVDSDRSLKCSGLGEDSIYREIGQYAIKVLGPAMRNG
jgi:hypothetical protein